MFFVSHGQCGNHAFLRACNSLPMPHDARAAMIARWLDVTPGTVRDWISGRRTPPRAPMPAMPEALTMRCARRQRPSTLFAANWTQ